MVIGVDLGKPSALATMSAGVPFSATKAAYSPLRMRVP